MATLPTFLTCEKIFIGYAKVHLSCLGEHLIMIETVLAHVDTISIKLIILVKTKQKGRKLFKTKY